MKDSLKYIGSVQSGSTLAFVSNKLNKLSLSKTASMNYPSPAKKYTCLGFNTEPSTGLQQGALMQALITRLGLNHGNS